MVVCLFFSISVFAVLQEVYAANNQAKHSQKNGGNSHLNGIDAAVSGTVPIAPRHSGGVGPKSGTRYLE